MIYLIHWQKPSICVYEHWACNTHRCIDIWPHKERHRNICVTDRLTLHTAHGWLVAKGLGCVFKKKDNQERAWKAERHRKRKKERERKRGWERKRKHNAQREKNWWYLGTSWWEHKDATKKNPPSPISLPQSFKLFHSLIHPIFVSQREKTRVRRTHGKMQKCYRKDRKDDNENFVMIYSPSSLLRRKKGDFLAECPNSFPYNKSKGGKTLSGSEKEKNTP